MALMSALFSVHDVEAFLAYHDRNDDLRRLFGCSAARVCRYAEDPSMVLVLLDFPTVDAGNGYLAAALEQGAVEHATLAGVPRIEMFDVVTER